MNTRIVTAGRGTDINFKKKCIERGDVYIEDDTLEPNKFTISYTYDSDIIHDENEKYIVCGKGSRSEIKKNCISKGYVYIETYLLQPDMVLVLTAEEFHCSVYK